MKIFMFLLNILIHLELNYFSKNYYQKEFYWHHRQITAIEVLKLNYNTKEKQVFQNQSEELVDSFLWNEHLKNVSIKWKCSFFFYWIVCTPRIQLFQQELLIPFCLQMFQVSALFKNIVELIFFRFSGKA